MWHADSMWFWLALGRATNPMSPWAWKVKVWFLGPSTSRLQMADLLSATATMPEQLTATAEQLTATAEQQTSALFPQPYAPDKQGPADFSMDY